MKSRSVTQRNFAGGFMGGMLGMLAFGYVHAALLPVGCLLGVVIGWWYELIGQAIANGAIMYPPLRLAISLVRYCIWLYSCPMRRWKAMRVVVTILYLAINALWVVPVWRSVISVEVVEKGTFAVLYFPLRFFGALISTIVLCVITPSFVFADYVTDYNCRGYGYFCTHPLWLSLLREFAIFCRMEALVVLKVAVVVGWYGVVGVAFLLIFIVPISVAIGLMKGISTAVMQTGHWLCFGVTFFVTGLSAWGMSGLIGTPSVLWMTALCTGLLSSIVSEGVRRLLIVWLERPRSNEFVGEYLMNGLSHGCSAFGMWTENVLGKIQLV